MELGTVFFSVVAPVFVHCLFSFCSLSLSETSIMQCNTSFSLFHPHPPSDLSVSSLPVPKLKGMFHQTLQHKIHSKTYFLFYPVLSYAMLCYAILSYPIHLILSYPILLHSISIYSISFLKIADLNNQIDFITLSDCMNSITF